MSENINPESVRGLRGMTAEGLIERAQSWPDTKGNGDALSSAYVSDLLDGIARAYLALSERVGELEREVEALRGAVSWIEPPFVERHTSHEEMFKRISFCVADTKRAALSHKGMDHG